MLIVSDIFLEKSISCKFEDLVSGSVLVFVSRGWGGVRLGAGCGCACRGCYILLWCAAVLGDAAERKGNEQMWCSQNVVLVEAEMWKWVKF